MARTTKFGKLSRKFLSPAIVAGGFSMLLSFVAGFVFDIPLMFFLFILSFSQFLYLLLLRKAFARTIVSSEPEFNFGFGKFEDLAICGNFFLLAASQLYLLFSVLNISIVGNYAENRLLLSELIFTIYLLFTAFSGLRLFFAKRFFKETSFKESKILLQSPAVYIEISAIILAYFAYTISIFLDINEHLIQMLGAVILLSALVIKNYRSFIVSLNNLLDRNLPENMLFDFLSAVIEENSYMCEYKSMRTRRSGKLIFIDVDAIMPRNLPISDIYNLQQYISNSIKEKYPDINFRLHALPCKQNCVYQKEGKCPVKRLTKGNDE